MAHLAKYSFHQNKVCFLKYVILAQRIKIRGKKIQVVKNSSKSKSMQDILVFLDFASFYQCFIQNFSKIAELLAFILKTILLIERLSKIAENNECKMVANLVNN